jgi:hypothetical protein
LDDPAKFAASGRIMIFVIDFGTPTCWNSKVEEDLTKGEIK